MSKLSLSYSSATRFKSCPQKYYYAKEYTSKIKASALVFGKALEMGVETLLKGGDLDSAIGTFYRAWEVNPKNKYEDEFPVLDSENVFYYANDFDPNLVTGIENRFPEIIWKEVVDSYKSKVKDGVLLDEPLKKQYNKICWWCCKNRGVYMLKAFKDQVLPNVRDVIATQKPITIQGSDGNKVSGFIDFILKYEGYEDPIVFDLKSSGREYDEHDLISSDQLKVYAAAENIRNVGYIVLSKHIPFIKSCDKCGDVRPAGSRKNNCGSCSYGTYSRLDARPISQVLIRRLSDAELNDIVEDFSEVITSIDNGVKWKNPSSCFSYGTVCEFYDVCWKNKNIDELSHLTKRRNLNGE